MCKVPVVFFSEFIATYRHVETARTWSQTGSSHIPLCYLALCDQLASWSKAIDSVMEFGLRHAHDVHTQVFDRLLAAREPARELVADLLASWSQAGWCNGVWSRTGLRPAS